MTLRFDGGAGSLLVTPLPCGPATTTARFTPHSGGAAVATQATVAVGPLGPPCGTPQPFAPSFEGGSTNARAGKSTAFTTTVRRRDGEQLPARLAIAFPAGMSAALGSVRRCPAAAAAAAACPAASRIGHAVAELGPGTSPGRLTGEAHLTGPYRGAPFGLALVFDAAIGPFDLGEMVVRGTLRVDPLSGQVTVETDALPRTFEGVAVRFQTIGLDIDRPGFIRNPTSCRPKSVAATLRSTAGAVSRSASRFAVRGCIDLPFRPAFSMALTDRRQQRRGGKPGLRIAARLPAGDAALRRVDALLPRLLRFDPSALRAVCSRGQALEGACPRKARVGTGYARTPLLDRALRGSIYVVQPRGAGTPDLWTSLEGAGIRVDLRAETAVEEGRLETSLVGLPDFPMASFAMRFAGGRRGIFALKGDPCGARRGLVAPLAIEGQNGVLLRNRARAATQADCGGDG
jgi:hypothetical protein